MENDTSPAPDTSALRRRGRPVGADSAATRRTIMGAARDLIAERGYHAATYQQIAVRAGVSRPTLHYYYASREELYAKLLDDIRLQVERCIAEAMRHCSLRRQLAAFMAEMHRLGTAEPNLMKVIVTARIDHHRGAHRHEAGVAVVATVHAFYDAVVVDAIRRGELAAGTEAHVVADMLAALFWGFGFHVGFVGAGQDAGDEERVGDPAEIARQLMRLLDRGLLGSPVRAPADV